MLVEKALFWIVIQELVVDGLEAVPDDLQRDRIERGLSAAHGSTSISRLPLSSTERRLPGGTSVVASNCVTTSGPSSASPAASALRSMKPVSVGLSALNQTGLVVAR